VCELVADLAARDPDRPIRLKHVLAGPNVREAQPGRTLVSYMLLHDDATRIQRGLKRLEALWRSFRQNRVDRGADDTAGFKGPVGLPASAGKDLRRKASRPTPNIGKWPRQTDAQADRIGNVVSRFPDHGLQVLPCVGPRAEAEMHMIVVGVQMAMRDPRDCM
jgi:hypothetical protein